MAVVSGRGLRFEVTSSICFDSRLFQGNLFIFSKFWLLSIKMRRAPRIKSTLPIDFLAQKNLGRVKQTCARIRCFDTNLNMKLNGTKLSKVKSTKF